jgi:PQQ-like domain
MQMRGLCRFFLRARVLLLTLCFVSVAAESQDVLTYHNNNLRNGWDSAETILKPANVDVASFGKLFTVPADGRVDAQPLYLSGVTISGVSRDLLIVATEHDSVYAYDANTGARIWHVSTLKSGERTSDDRSCSQVSPEIGITSTPVIRRLSTGDPVIYVVAMSKDDSGNYHQRLHALDATTGSELFHGPVEISAQYRGDGDSSKNGYVVFESGQYKERAGLLLLNDTIYLAWASHCDHRPYTGWIVGYSASTLAQTTVLNLTPNGGEGAIWGSGAGLAADSSGNVFLLDANGDFDTTLNASGFPANSNYGNAFLRLTSTGGLSVADYFEMYNQAGENGSDTDLGSGGTLLLNQNDNYGKTWQLAVGAGKDGNLYIVDRTNMGKFHSGSNHIYQELKGALPGGVWSMPAAFGKRIYYGPVGSPILAFEFGNAKLEAKPVARTTNAFGYPGVTPSISSNSNSDAIVWAVENSNPAVLHAYDASTLIQIYDSNQPAGGRDHFGSGNKFITPTIARGRVYVATTDGVGVFGLLK